MTSNRFAYYFAALLALALAVVPANAFQERSDTAAKRDFLSKQLQAQLAGDVDRFSTAVSIRANNAAPIVGSQVEITEIKTAGVSAAKETHSIVQVAWASLGAPDVKISSFELLLEVTYADGFVEKSPAKAPGSARSTRFEVPSLHRAGNQPAAEMKSFKVSITANYSETTTKQVSL